jgi:hypothetical protein
VEEETAVAEDLQLLADFVADVTVAGMQRFEFAFEGVDVLVCEFFVPQSVDEVEDVEGPAAFGDGEFGEGFDFAEAGADYAGGGDDLVAGVVEELARCML